MFVHHRTQGFVLKKVDQGEADQLFSIYTEDFGKLRVLARSIRKITSKLRAGIPVFSISEIEFIQGKTFKTLTDAILIQDFENIKKDLEKFKIAGQIIQVFEQLIKPPQKDDKIYALLSEVFNVLNDCFRFQVSGFMIYYYFFWNLVSILGYKPELYECLICRKKLEPKNLYFSKKAGIVCESCVNKKHESGLLKADVDIIKILREILRKDLNRFLKIKINHNHQESLKQISDFYILSLPN